MEAADWEELRAVLVALTWSGFFVATLIMRSGHDQFRTWQHFLPVTMPVLAGVAALVGPRTGSGTVLLGGFVFVGTAVVFGFAASGSDQGLWPIGMVLVSTCMAAVAAMGAVLGGSIRTARQRRA